MAKKTARTKKTRTAPQSFRAPTLDLAAIVKPKTPRNTESGPKLEARLFYSSDKNTLAKNKEAMGSLPGWQKEKILSAPNKLFKVTQDTGVRYFCWLEKDERTIQNEKSLQALETSRIRDLCGALSSELEHLGVTHLEITLLKAPQEAEKAFALGMELANYRFTRAARTQKTFTFEFTGNSKKTSLQNIESGQSLGAATNLARHLVNLPPNLLNPVSYADAVQELFRGQKNVQVEVWD